MTRPSLDSSSMTRGTSLRSLAPSVARSSTRRSARIGAVARTPVSPTPSCGSCEIRNTSARCSGLQLAIGGSVVEAADELVDLLEEDAALEHAGRLGAEHEVAADDRAERLVGDAARRFVDDLQLGAQHAGLAGLVDGAQCSFPEASAGRQKRVVRHDGRPCPRLWLRCGYRRAVGRSRRTPCRASSRCRRPCRASCAARPCGRRSRRRCRTGRR